jgi:hypothetical protein
LTLNLGPHQAVVDFESVDFLVYCPVLVFEGARTLNNFVDTLLRLLGQVQPSLISLQYLIDGLGENAAGERDSRCCEKRRGNAPTAANAPIHERSLKGRMLLLKVTERDATYQLNTCTN